MKITIIIPTTLNRIEYMENIFEGLVSQSGDGHELEVLIVCSRISPTPFLRELVDSWSGKLVLRLFHCQKNGLHNARHVGARHASNPWLIYIDDDVRLCSGWLNAYADFFESNRAGCVGGKVLPEWGEQPPEWVFDISPDIFSLLDYGLDVRALAPHEGINGCNFAIRKDVLFRYGGFHPDGFAGKEMDWFRGDGEYGLVQKIKKDRGLVFYLPDAVLHHRIPTSRFSISALQRAYRLRAFSSAYYRLRASVSVTFMAFVLVIYGYLGLVVTNLKSVFIHRSTLDPVLQIVQSRYIAFAEYGWKVLFDRSLRAYIQKENYLEE